MPPVKTLRVVIVKPSKYDPEGWVERFRWGFMPNSTVPYLASMTPERIGAAACQTHAIDEYVQTDLAYLKLSRARSRRRGCCWPSSACRVISSTALSTSPGTPAKKAPARSSAGRMR